MIKFVINTIIEQQITSIEEIVYLNLFDSTELEFATEVFEFNDVAVEDSGDMNFSPTEQPQEEITYETVELEMQDFEIDIPEPEIVEVEIQAEIEIELEMKMEESIQVDDVEETVNEKPTEKDTTEVNNETDEKPVVEDNDSSEQKEIKESQEEPEQKPVKEPSAKEKAATKIVKKINDKERYDDAAQMKTLIVMQILGNTKTFFDTQSTIVDTNVNEYLNKTIEDQYGLLFQLAQDVSMEDMINAQY